MSLRRLYNTIPVSKRLCSYYRCQQPILRNIDRDEDGRIYHHGCLMAAQDERHRCLNCGGAADGRNIAFVDDFGTKVPACPYCGSYNFAGRNWHSEPETTFPHEALPKSYDPFREPWSGERSW